MRRLLDEGGYDGVVLLPLWELTQPRWGMHERVRHVHGTWVLDCTHFCFSPEFFDAYAHVLHSAVAEGIARKRRRGERFP